MINLSSLDIANKNLVIRVDMNVPLKDSEVLDSTRIKAFILVESRTSLSFKGTFMSTLITRFLFAISKEDKLIIY